MSQFLGLAQPKYNNRFISASWGGTTLACRNVDDTCHNNYMSHALLAVGAPPPANTALLLVNLGTPTHPTAAAVGRYLSQFLSDRHVVPLSPLLWKPLLHGLVIPLRRRRSAEKYRQIWLPEGSPLAVYTQRLTAEVAAQLPHWHVTMAMRYGQPALPFVLDTLVKKGIERIVVLPLYPQYSTTTTATVQQQVREWWAKNPQIAVHTIYDYADDCAWAAAVADSINTYWQQHGRGEQLLFSFHGLPQKLVDQGDPYPQRCELSVHAITRKLGLNHEQWQLAYQSRFGRHAWVQPYAEPTLWQWAERGMKTIDVVCPGFAVDCLETLEEVALRFAEGVAARGAQLRYIPCLNATFAHAQALAALAQAQANEHFKP